MNSGNVAEAPSVKFPTYGQRNRRSLGFSLVEVAIAVAIAAVGLTAVLGVLPSSLESVREAGNSTARARIVSEILGEIQLSDWGRMQNSGISVSSESSGWTGLNTLLARTWYFDDQANSLSESSPNFRTRISFVARARISTSPLVLSGGAGPSASLKNIQIDIAVIPDPDFDFDNPNLYVTHPGIVARRYSQPN